MSVYRIAPVVLVFVAWSVLVASASAQPEGPLHAGIYDAQSCLRWHCKNRLPKNSS